MMILIGFSQIHCKMIHLDYSIICFFVLFTTLSAQIIIIDNPCTFELTNSPGVCKLLTDCSRLRYDLINFNRLPQTCGFHETQAIVCCPKEPKPGDISKRKCREYSVYADENISGSAQSTRNECGHKIVKRIVGGVTASRKEFSHMAILGFKDEEKAEDIVWLCGGSIISEEYIITNANCWTGRLPRKYPNRVTVGVTNINKLDHKQEIKISEIIRHPNHRFGQAYNDIALVKLEKTINLSSYARPACLYTEQEVSTGNAIATGWGVTSWKGSLSNDLLKVTLNLVDHEVCNNSYSSFIPRSLRYGILKDSQVCAGSDKDEKDTCQGDSGGPLQIYHIGDNISCMYDIVGITSFGRSCMGSPGVYTRVSHYIKWLEDTVWSEPKR